jgi:hypothetical protein
MNFGLSICIGSCTPGTIGYIFGLILGIINNVLVPVLFAIAFIVFLYGVFKYFIFDAASSDKSEGARFILYGIVGFAIMICVWGLVNIVVGTFGLDSQVHPPYPTL